MISVKAENNVEHVDVELNINGTGRDVADEIEAIVTELLEWMLKSNKAMFVDHLAKMVAKGLALLMDGYDNRTETKANREGAN